MVERHHQGLTAVQAHQNCSFPPFQIAARKMLCEEEVSGECVDDFAVSNIMKERDVTNEKKSDGDDDLDEDARSIMTALEEYSEKNVRFLYELVQSGTYV